MEKRNLPKHRSKKLSIGAIASDAFIVLLCLILIWLLIQSRRAFSRTDEQIRFFADTPHTYFETQTETAEIVRACADEVFRFIPGVVCWGDAAAVGNANGSLPGKLNRLLNRSLFSDLEENLALQANFYNVYSLNIPVANMGVSREGMHEILARCGASRLLLAADYSIPLYGQMANIALMDEAGNELHFAEQKYAKFNKTIIQGVSGYLYVGIGSYDKDHPILAFTREYQGLSLTAAMGTAIETESATVYRQFLPVLYFQSTLGQTDEAFIQALCLILDHHENPGGYCAVIVCTQAHSSLDEALKDTFGTRYIRGEKATADMSETDFSQLAQTVYACLDEQGAFSAVREAIQTAMKRIMENNSL